MKELDAVRRYLGLAGRFRAITAGLHSSIFFAAVTGQANDLFKKTPAIHLGKWMGVIDNIAGKN